jgi:CRISPR-associated endonuclease/helicase Cas3
MEPLAKPSGITYREHRQHVFEEAEKMLTENSFWCKKYATLTEGDLRNQVRRAAWWHDVGKLHRQWQTACRKDYELYQKWRQAANLPPNKRDAADFKRFERERRQQKVSSSPHLLQAKLRHEFDSLLQATNHFKNSDPLSLAEMVAIAAHHGKLGTRYEERWRTDGKASSDKSGPFSILWDELNRESKILIPSNKQEWAKKIIERYKVAGVRTLLRLADTRASRLEGEDPVPEMKAFSYRFTHSKKNGVQKIAEESAASQRLSILRAPTGSGKTDAALLWAKKQIASGNADRLVVAMPTRFTSNALAMSVDRHNSYNSTGLYHSSAWYNRYGEVSDSEKSTARELHKLAQFLLTPTTVCTIDHLLLSLTGTKEDHHSTFFFLANSAVVFDEADFYDPFVQSNLLVLLETLKILNVPVLIMSATIPDSSLALYGLNEDTDKILDVPAEGRSPKRSIVWRGKAEFPEDVDGILRGMVRQRTGIIYANTVDRAYAYYKWFKNQQELGGPRPILYHSRFTEPHKKDIESDLLTALGKQAWHEGGAEGIAILTQIGEMSVNISAPTMLSDACPWDRLTQRAGRLDRFDLSAVGGILFIVEPIKNGETYPAPYGEPKRGGGWLPAEPFTKTLDELKRLFDEVPRQVTAQEFVNYVNDLYPNGSEFEANIKQNSSKLKRLMETNWMIVPAQHTDEENATVSGQWKSRDIPAQETVLVSPPEAAEVYDFDTDTYFFRNWDELRSYQLEYGISCPIYLIEKAKRLQQLIPLKYQIGDDRAVKVLWIVEAGVYQSDTGLATLGTGNRTDRARGIIY